ncbi:cytoplasmic protein [Cryptococcus neoformans A2-102-5]|nr:cytoplasmic protein [Cryptococcus neoformans var. grubii MW-RSA36]OXG76853.1 cytoplasmic protein [Cryptococcus neoformans var. grubii D17-1]OXG90868.1 cytoplasmic protein [Cryptococcus neoformans var. grubii A2-102-5]
MDQQSSSYPPSYHVSTRQAFEPHASYHTRDYQRRRDERHAQRDAAYAGGVEGRGTENPYWDPRGAPANLDVQQPLYPSHAGDRPIASRTGSGSGSVPSNPLLSDAERGAIPSVFAVSSKEGEYPEGWTKEDEEAEREFMKRGMIDWNELKSWRFWIRKEWWYYYIILAVICVLVILMSVYHDDIVNWMKPAANWMKNLTAGWVIPIAVFFVISFPPLFGHEIVAILVGAVWGLWIGFGITAAGTLLGEIGNFYAFKYCLRSTAEKYEKNNINYACLAHVVREGGFFIIFVARLSAIPGHFTTAVFATCGMNIWIFTLAAILSLPKQLIVVYLGVMFDSEEKSTKEKWISHGVLIFGFIITLWSAWYIWRKMQQARLTVWRRRRIEAAAQGLVLDPITLTTRPSSHAGGRVGEGDVRSLGYDRDKNGEDGYKMEQIGDGEDETQSPILREHRRDERNEREGRVGYGGLGVRGGRGGAVADAGRHQSYQNPYDIRYQNADEMSVYDVDVNGPPVHAADERDITYGYGYQPAVSSETFLPQHIPVQHPPQLQHQPPERQSSIHFVPPYSHSQSQSHPQIHSQSHSHSHSPSNFQPQETLVYFPEAHSTGIESTPDGHLGLAGQPGTTVHRSATKATVYAKEEENVAFPKPKPNRI